MDKHQQKINEAMAKLTLQLEDERRVQARADNVVAEMQAASPLARILSWAEDQYAEAGEKARKAAADAKADFKGHPNGKKPDALLASLLLRVVVVVRDGSANVPFPMYCGTKLQDKNEEAKEEVVEALDVLAERAQTPALVRAKRRFQVKVKDEVKGELVRWIMAPSKDADLEEALATLMKHQALKPIGVTRSGAVGGYGADVPGGQGRKSSGFRRQGRGRSEQEEEPSLRHDGHQQHQSLGE